MIQNLFPDRAIKAQKFIDLISCNRNNDKQQFLRVYNPNEKKIMDVEMAVKELLNHLEDRNIKINIQRSKNVGVKDPFIYDLVLPEGKTSGLRARSARNQYGAPFSHLPTDKVMSVKIKLSLSGGQLMVKSGGGYVLFIEYLENKGFFKGMQQI
jgi:hypothetical protein